jgi:hypothetical protein
MLNKELSPGQESIGLNCKFGTSQQSLVEYIAGDEPQIETAIYCRHYHPQPQAARWEQVIQLPELQGPELQGPELQLQGSLLLEPRVLQFHRS